MNWKLFTSWEFVLLKALVLAAAAAALSQPVGSITGKIALEQPGFGLYRQALREHRVYALASLHDDDVSRGVWVNPDGSFQLDQLPAGEYILKLHATGYRTTYRYGIFVEDGKTTRIPAVFRMSLLPPSVSVASNTRVFTTAESPYFWVSVSGAEEMRVQIYRQDLRLLMLRWRVKSDLPFEISTDLRIYKRHNARGRPFTSGKPILTLTRTISGADADWARKHIKLAKPLPPGFYLALAEVSNQTGRSDWNVMGFQVTDLGLIIKQDSRQTLVRAVDLVTLRPKSAVAVEILSGIVKDRAVLQLNEENVDIDAWTHRLVSRGLTGPDGFAAMANPSSLKGGGDGNLVVAATDGPHEAWGGLWFNPESRSRHYSYFYTDKPVYRLGQTVAYKVISRQLTPEGFRRLPAGSTVKVLVEDPDNTKLYEGSVKTSLHGTWNGILQLPASGRTGSYSVTFTYPDGKCDYEQIEVSQYRKPQYKVEVRPLAGRVVAGAGARARIRATYYFGAPVARAKIRYSIFASPYPQLAATIFPRQAYDAFFDESYEGSEYAYFGRDLVYEGYAWTDETGEAVIDFKTKPVRPPKEGPFGVDFGDQRYKIEAAVTDLSRMTVIGSGYLNVTAGDLALDLTPDQYVVKAGEPVKAAVTLYDYSSKPAGGQTVTVELSRWRWDSVKSRYHGQKVEGIALARTGADGKAALSIKTPGSLPTGAYYLTASAPDRSGHTIYAQTSVWIASQAQPYLLDEAQAQKQPLQVVLDRKVYRAGDTARVLITAPVTGSEGSEAIVCIEGEKIHEYRAIPMTASARLIEIPVRKVYEPNVWVSVTFVGRGRQYYEQSVPLKVSPLGHFLNMEISTNKEEYRSGDTVRYSVKATDRTGRPATNVELSLSLVDESMYAIRPDPAPDIQRFFFGPRGNSVTTVSSFPEEYSGGPDKMAGARVRKDFRDTAAWLPDLTTDATGTASASIKLPDNLTTWRATVRGINLDTDVGSAKDTIISTQDLFVRLALPRFFSQGDRSSITAIVHNYTKAMQSVKLTLKASDHLQVSAPLKQSLTVGPDKARRLSWPVSLVKPGRAEIAVSAVGRGASDAVEHPIQVLPLGLSALSASGGVLTRDRDSASWPAMLSAKDKIETARLKLSLSASTLGAVVGNYSALIDYPYGCTEQTMSRLVPSVVAMRLNKELGLPLPETHKRKFQDVLTAAVARLRDYQNYDGGWGWWQYASSDLYMTALVLDGFELVEEAGYTVPWDGWKQGHQWLKKQLPALWRQLADPKRPKEPLADLERMNDFAMALKALSNTGYTLPAPLRSSLLARINRCGPEALALMTLVFSKSGDDQAARLCYQHLIGLANQSGEYMEWAHSKTLLQKLIKESWPYSYTYRFTDSETTALALQAVVQMEPENIKRIESIKNWLLLQKGKDGWDNTKTTARVFLALLKEELASSGLRKTNFKADCRLAGSERLLADISFDPANMYQAEKVIDIPVKRRSQTLTLSKDGPGRLYYNSLLSYVKDLSPGDHLKIDSSPGGIRVKREFFRLTAKQSGSNETIRFEAVPLGNSTIRAGETVLMKLYLETPLALPYVILDAALPSGAEVVSGDPREELVDTTDSEEENLWGEWWWTHQDVLDDRVVFFASELPAGKKEFHALVRMEMPGSFQMNPVLLSGMYSERVRAYSDLDSVTVVE